MPSFAAPSPPSKEQTDSRTTRSSNVPSSNDTTTSNSYLYQAFNMGNIGAGLLVRGDTTNSFVFLRHALDLINQCTNVQVVDNTMDTEMEDLPSNQTQSTASEALLTFQTMGNEIQDLSVMEDPNNNGLHIYNQAWIVGLRQGPLLSSSDSACMMTAIILFNLALHQHQQGEFHRALMLYQKCTNLLESDAAVSLCRVHYDLHHNWLMLAAYNNQATIYYGQGNLVETTKLLDRVRTLYCIIHAKKQQQQQLLPKPSSSQQQEASGDKDEHEAGAGAGAA